MTTGSPSPFFNSDDMGDARRKMTERANAVEKRAHSALVLSGEEYLRRHGIEKLKQDIEVLKTELQVWNSITGSTLRFSLATVDLMLQIMATLPFNVQLPQLVMNHEWAHRNAMLAAVRNHLKKEIAEKANGNLSTGEGTVPPKAA